MPRSCAASGPIRPPGTSTRSTAPISDAASVPCSGRYPGDVYDGDTDAQVGDHPWAVSTANFAERNSTGPEDDAPKLMERATSSRSAA